MISKNVVNYLMEVLYMRRWNGWGHETVEYPLQDNMLNLLKKKLEILKIHIQLLWKRYLKM